MRIGVDLDGVVFDSEKEFRVYSELYDILELKKDSKIDNKKLRFQDRFNWKQEELQGFLNKYHKQIIVESNFMPGVKSVLQLMKQDGHSLILITARGSINKDMIKITEERLKNAGMDIFDKYYWATENKDEICVKENIDIMIDDFSEKCESIATKEIKTIYLKDAPSYDLKENEYKINEILEPPCYFPDNEGNSAEWIITYYKVYGDALNQFERVQVMFTVIKGKLTVYSAFIGNEKVEYIDNPVEITKEEAEKIALEQDKKITDNEVDWIITKQQIRQVNSWIYLLEKNGGKYPELKEEKQADGTIEQYPEYQTVQNIARKVWTVNIHYKQGEPDQNDEKKYHSKSIFVDVTTGEVIGGADESYWE